MTDQTNDQYAEAVNEYRKYYQEKVNELKEIETTLSKLENPTTKEEALNAVMPLVLPRMASNKTSGFHPINLKTCFNAYFNSWF